MTFNVRLHGDLNIIEAHIKRYEYKPMVASYEDFNGQTLHKVVTGLGFHTEKDRFQFILEMSGKLYQCDPTNEEFNWGHIEF
jgi:hypothetical protein